MVGIIILILLIPLAILLYFLAVKSRKTYRCPQCKEEIRVEYLDAKRCGMCGAPLKKKEEWNEKG